MGSYNKKGSDETIPDRPLCIPSTKNFFESTEKNHQDGNLYLLFNKLNVNKGNSKKNPASGCSGKIRSIGHDLLKDSPQSDHSLCSKKALALRNQLIHKTEMLAKAFPMQAFIDFKPQHRLILSEGGGSPYSNVQNLRLHQLYGLPYIPASAIKGTLRSCWISEKFQGDESQAISDKTFAQLFGVQNSAEESCSGNLVFFDVFASKFSMGLDVQTSHYPGYYSKNNMEPTDDQDPTPIYFVCLEKPEFKIWIACRDQKLWTQEKENVTRMMHTALKYYGIGAKTALGYGMI